MTKKIITNRLVRIAVFNNHKGMALMVTLAIISVLMVAVLEIVRSSNDSAETEKQMADRLQAYEMARSGIELAKFILILDAEQNEIDSLQEMWANPEILVSAVELLEFDKEQGGLDVIITDELGKIQINALLAQFPGNMVNNDQIALWERFLNLIISSDKSVDVRDPSEIINSIIDWLDSGDDDAISGLSGAESDYYEALDPQVKCSNGPINTVKEIFMIKGVPKTMTYIPAELLDESGSLFPDASGDQPNSQLKTLSSDGNALFSASFKNQSKSHLPVEPSEIFTVYGSDSSSKEGARFSYPGTININTANLPVLSAMLPVGMEDQASELARFRVEKEQNGELFKNNLDRGWYKKVISLSQKDAQQFDKIVRYSSYLFRVDSIAEFNGVVVSLSGFIKREKNSKSGKWSCSILQLVGN